MLTIGQLAGRFGLNPSAIRSYEANGVLPPSARGNGHRRYGPDAVRRMAVLDVAKRPGFSRAEAMHAWLLTAADCSCTTLDVCALFDPHGPAPRCAPAPDQ